jgi:hypothetical protein
MNATTTLPATVQLRRSHLVGLVAASAALAAGITCALLIFAVHDGNQGTRGAAESSYVQAIAASDPEQLAAAYGTPEVSALSTLDPARIAYVQGIMRSTPTELVAAFGNVGVPLDYDFYSSPTASDNEYVQGIVSSTPEELAAAFGR